MTGRCTTERWWKNGFPFLVVRVLTGHVLVNNCSSPPPPPSVLPKRADFMPILALLPPCRHVLPLRVETHVFPGDFWKVITSDTSPMVRERSTIHGIKWAKNAKTISFGQIRARIPHQCSVCRVMKPLPVYFCPALVYPSKRMAPPESSGLFGPSGRGTEANGPAMRAKPRPWNTGPGTSPVLRPNNRRGVSP